MKIITIISIILIIVFVVIYLSNLKYTQGYSDGIVDMQSILNGSKTPDEVLCERFSHSRLAIYNIDCKEV